MNDTAFFIGLAVALGYYFCCWRKREAKTPDEDGQEGSKGE